MSKRETLFADVLSDLEDGLISPRDARKNLRGQQPPNDPARLIKEGRWSVDGGYPTGREGAQMAARDALDQMARDQIALAGEAG